MLALYEEAKVLDETLLLEDYLKSVFIDDTTVLSFTSRDLIITYSCVLVGDIDGNQLLEQADLLALIDQVIGKEEVDTNKADVYSDGSVDLLDVMHLHQVLLNDTWASNIEELEGTIDSKLNVMSESIISGDEFKIDYVLSVDELPVNGISGLINYDEEMLELVGVESSELLVGNNYDGKFLYLSDESLLGTEVELEDGSISVEAKDYVVLTMTFKALKSGVSSVEILDAEYFDQGNYYVGETSSLSVDVIVDESNDSTLKSLVVAGQEIVLEDGVLEYTIDVTNDVVSALVEAITSNVAAAVTSIVSPEELVEGENVITIVVTAENGDETIYTIVVNRAAAPVEEEKEETTTQLNYENNYTQDNNVTVENDNDDTTILDSDKDKDKKDESDKKVDEESNLSRIIIIILILLVVAGLIYLIFKDEDEEDRMETKKANREINKMKNDKEFVSKNENIEKQKPKNNSDKNKNNKKGR